MPANNPFGYLSPELQAEQSGIDRRRRLAEVLLQQGLQSVAPRQAGNVTIAPHPLEGIARIVQVAGGLKLGEMADRQAADVGRRSQESRAQALANALRTARGEEGQPPSPLAAFNQLAQTGDPFALQSGAHMLNFQQREMEGRENREARMQERILMLDAATQNRDIARADRERAAQEAATLRRELQASQQAFAAQQQASQQAFSANQAQQNRAFQSTLAEQARGARNPQIIQTDQGPMILEGGQAKPIPGPAGTPVRGPATDKPLTEFQGKNVLFGARATSADQILSNLEEKINVTGLAAKQAAQNMPIIGGALGVLGNVALSKEQQRVEQAQRDFVNAILRQESGAVISPSEFENAQKQYFPQPGDSSEVIAQKRGNRAIAIGGLKRLAGPGGADIEALQQTPLMPGGNTQLRRSTDIEELVRKYGKP